MKKILKPLGVAILSASVLTGCMGKFQVTKNVYNWNKKVDANRWVQEGVFVAFLVIPVYSLTFLVDGLVTNSIEWWTGKNPVAAAGEQKKVIGADGSEALMTMRADGDIDVEVKSADGSQDKFTLSRADDTVTVLDAQGKPMGVTLL